MILRCLIIFSLLFATMATVKSFIVDENVVKGLFFATLVGINYWMLCDEFDKAATPRS